MTSFLKTLALLAIALVGEVRGADGPRFPALDNKEAWQRLPRETPQLPVWARTLAVSQPKTTGGVLALDYLHRAKNPLGAELAAKVRWSIADAMKIPYAKAYARADLKRAGVSEADIVDFINGDVTPGEQLILKVARKLTTAGYSVTDPEMAAVVTRLGPDKAVALVHTVAFANFHFRIVHALGATVEKDGPYPPIDFKYDVAQPALVDAPARPAWDTVKSLTPKQTYGAPDDWKEVGVEELDKSLATQQARKSRIPMPDKSRFERMPPDVKKQTDTIVWMTVSAGYQPEMTMAWFAAFRAYQLEGKSNPVFSSSLFWVVTRSNDCFY